MTGSHVVAALAGLVAIAGAATSTTWMLTVGGATAVWFFLVGESDDEAIRGLLTFLSIPVILTVAILTTS